MQRNVAVVTGGSRGLGAETARQLARRGLTVVVTSRSEERARDAAERMARHGDVVGLALDSRRPAGADAFVRVVLDRFGRVDVLVNNSGTYLDREARTGGEATWLARPELFLEMMAVNVAGPLHLISAFLPGMVERGYGRIVNVSSGMGRFGEMLPDSAYYRMSKLCLNALTRIAAAEAASSGVLVNAVCPGWVRTRMGGGGAPRSVAEGAEGILWAALLPPGGPSGQFFRDGVPLDFCGVSERRLASTPLDHPES